MSRTRLKPRNPVVRALTETPKHGGRHDTARKAQKEVDRQIKREYNEYLNTTTKKEN